MLKRHSHIFSPDFYTTPRPARPARPRRFASVRGTVPPGKPRIFRSPRATGFPATPPRSRQISLLDYDGGTNYPPDVAQNVPGAIYNTESAFEWQNNSTNGPPTPNPPFGTGAIQVQAGEVAPLNSVGFGGLNTGISGAGIGDAGTRIALQFTGIPQGASVQVPPLIYIFPASAGSRNLHKRIYRSDASDQHGLRGRRSL